MNLAARYNGISAGKVSVQFPVDSVITGYQVSNGAALSTDAQETWTTVSSPSSSATENSTLIVCSLPPGQTNLKIPVFRSEVYYALFPSTSILLLYFEPI